MPGSSENTLCMDIEVPCPQLSCWTNQWVGNHCRSTMVMCTSHGCKWVPRVKKGTLLTLHSILLVLSDSSQRWCPRRRQALTGDVAPRLVWCMEQDLPNTSAKKQILSSESRRSEGGSFEELSSWVKKRAFHRSLLLTWPLSNCFWPSPLPPETPRFHCSILWSSRWAKWKTGVPCRWKGQGLALGHLCKTGWPTHLRCREWSSSFLGEATQIGLYISVYESTGLEYRSLRPDWLQLFGWDWVLCSLPEPGS